MKDCRQFYIDGKWIAPTTPNDFPVTNPANEDHVAVISLGTAADVDKAVKAARKAFETFGETSLKPGDFLWASDIPAKRETRVVMAGRGGS